MIDGSALRSGMSRDLGFTKHERSENLRRGMELARAMNEIGLIVLASFTAPDASVRARARELVGRERFALVHVSTPIDACRRRDPSGLYAAAARGSVKDVPGLDLDYETPTDADLVLPIHELGSGEAGIRAAVERVLAYLEAKGALIR